MTELYEEDLAIHRALNSRPDPETMRRLITARKLVRAGLEFERVVRGYEQRAARPDRRDSSPFRRG